MIGSLCQLTAYRQVDAVVGQPKMCPVVLSSLFWLDGLVDCKISISASTVFQFRYLEQQLAIRNTLAVWPVTEGSPRSDRILNFHLRQTAR